MKSTVRIGDKDFLVESDDTYLNSIGREFEPAMVELFKALITPDMVVMDVGGNIGLTSLLFSTIASEVHVFEPSPSTHAILEFNLKTASASNVTSYNVGLASEPGSALITRSRSNRSGAFVSDVVTRISDHLSESISLDTLDEICKTGCINPGFIKIDVEGFEEEVLRGGNKVLARNRPVAVMELNHGCLNILHRKSVPDYIDFLRSVFPYLYALDTDNSCIGDMHDESQAYSVMHEHVMRNRYPNLVGGFDEEVRAKLEDLVERCGAAPISNAIGVSEIVAAPAKVQANEAFWVEVQIENNSDQVWRGTPMHPLNLSYHWVDIEGHVSVFDGLRTPTPSSGFFSGLTPMVIAEVIAPGAPGTYQLFPSLVQEGVAWLDQRGLASKGVTIMVQ